MPEERFAGTKLILQIVQTGGVVVAVISLIVSYQLSKQEYEWRREHFTVELLGKFKDQVREHREILMQTFPALHHSDGGCPPSREQCARIIAAKKGAYLLDDKSDAFEVRHHVVSVLNIFEHVAFAYERQLGDRDAIEASFSPLILRWHGFFANFIEEQNREFGADMWPPLTRVAQKWKVKKESAIRSP
jgi:hypothetical protein